MTGTAPNFTYTPAPNYNGPDSFTFKASDGALDSAATTVSISVTPINDAPVAQAQTVTTLEDTPLDLLLAGTDIEGSALTFEVVTSPTHGTLSGTAPNLVYTPSPNFNGTDSLSYKANDGALDSVAALISITVTPVNDAPTAADTAITTAEDSPATVNLPGSDVDGDSLTWAIITMPKHGTVSGSGALKTYTPEANFSGADDFTFTVSDGTLTSAVFTAKVTVTSVDDAPVAQDVVATTTQDTAVNITLTASDLEGDALTFTVTKQPAHGTLTGTSDQLVYTPERGFSGSDVFAFKANDGTLDSNEAQVTVAVAPAGSTPKDTTQLQGWSCGCQATEGSATVWLVLALLGWQGTRRQKRSHLRSRAVAPVLLLTLAFSVGDALAAAPASPTKAAPKTAKKKKGTAPATPPVKPAEPAPVAAEPPPPPPVTAPAPKGKVSVAVLDVQVTVVGEKLDTDSFTETVVNSVDGTGVFRVISSRDVATMLGYERQKQLLGCGDDSCIAEIASALGSDLLLQANVGKVGNQYVVSARLLDARRSQVVGRGSLKAEGAGALLEALWRTSQQALEAYGSNLLGDDAKTWAARPKQEPPASIVQKASTPSSFALTALAVGGYQPLAASGHHLTIGAEVDVSWRFGRLDTSVGVVVSPTPGARLSVAWALVDGPHRFSLGLRGSAFFGAAAYGGGPAVFYEWLFNPHVGLNAVLGGEVYASANTVVLSTMGGLGVSGHY